MPQSKKQSQLPNNNGSVQAAREQKGDGSHGEVRNSGGQLQSSSTPSKKGISANHLLNFTLPPRQPSHSQQFNSGRHTNHKKVNHQPYVKERFVNANYRFVVKTDEFGKDMNPDQLVTWSNVELVLQLAAQPDDIQCPICLCPPSVPKMGKCGHVFCYSCILHYLSIVDSMRVKCPLCHDSVCSKDLKSCQVIQCSDYSKTQKIDGTSRQPVVAMTLMQRSNASITTLPKFNYSKWANSSMPKLQQDWDMNLIKWSKVLVAYPSVILHHIIMPEIVQLQFLLHEAQSANENDEALYLEMAISEQKERERVLLQHSPALLSQTDHHNGKMSMLDVRQLSSSLPSNAPVLDDLQLPPSASITIKASVMEDPFADIESSIQEQVETGSSGGAQSLSDGASTSSLSSRKSVVLSGEQKQLSSQGFKYGINASKGPVDGTYYFYQCSDGQYSFLHPLDIKIIKSAFGEYQDFPHEIYATISVVTETTMTEEVRKKYRYLGHLPLGCDVSFIELDWKKPALCRQQLMKNDNQSGLYIEKYLAGDINDELTPILTDEQISHWQSELDSRQKRHEQKKRKEEQSARKNKKQQSKSNDSVNLDELTRFEGGIGSARTHMEMFDFDDESAWQPLPLSPVLQSSKSGGPLVWNQTSVNFGNDKKNQKTVNNSYNNNNNNNRNSMIQSNSYAKKARPRSYNELFPQMDVGLTPPSNGMSPPKHGSSRKNKSFASITGLNNYNEGKDENVHVQYAMMAQQSSQSHSNLAAAEGSANVDDNAAGEDQDQQQQQQQQQQKGKKKKKKQKAVLLFSNSGNQKGAYQSHAPVALQ
ncbi:hypothetical protein MP228_006469 [Amoeboaphelidium protococcarum]|nr:hypothetical protein MP228_006469 [Amoeboaphelidium protococcarum]